MVKYVYNLTGFSSIDSYMDATRKLRTTTVLKIGDIHVLHLGRRKLEGLVARKRNYLVLYFGVQLRAYNIWNFEDTVMQSRV